MEMQPGIHVKPDHIWMQRASLLSHSPHDAAMLLWTLV